MSSGPRYTDWTHTRVVGNPDLAAPYVPYARKLLGYVMDEAERADIGMHKIVRKLDDGTVVTAEKIGSIPRITIEPVEVSGGESEKFRTRVFVPVTTDTDVTVKVVDLADYEVKNGEILQTREFNQILGSFVIPGGIDVTGAAASVDGSYHKPKGAHASAWYTIDFGTRDMYAWSPRDNDPRLHTTFPGSGTTALQYNVIPGGDIYSFDVASRAVNKISRDDLSVLASATGFSGLSAFDGQTMAVSKDKRTLWVAETDATTNLARITSVDTESMTVSGSIDVSLGYDDAIVTTGFALSPDGKTLYAVGYVVVGITPIPGLTDLGSVVMAIDTATMTILRSRFYDVQAWYASGTIKVSRDGSTLYTASPTEASSDESGNIRVIDAETFDIVYASYDLYYVFGFGLSPDEKYYYIVGNLPGEDVPLPPAGNMAIAVMNLETNTLHQMIDLGILGQATAGGSFVTIRKD